jgi:chromosome segregation ATPase
VQRIAAPPNKPLINPDDMLKRRRISGTPDGLVKLMSMSVENEDQESLRARSEQAIGELAQALLDSQVLENALAAAFGAREKAVEAQQAAMAALNLPSAADVERLERRLRSFSRRLEDVEDQIDRVGAEIAGLRRELKASKETVEVED